MSSLRLRMMLCNLARLQLQPLMNLWVRLFSSLLMGLSWEAHHGTPQNSGTGGASPHPFVFLYGFLSRGLVSNLHFLASFLSLLFFVYLSSLVSSLSSSLTDCHVGESINLTTRSHCPKQCTTCDLHCRYRFTLLVAEKTGLAGQGG